MKKALTKLTFVPDIDQIAPDSDIITVLFKFKLKIFILKGLYIYIFFSHKM